MSFGLAVTLLRTAKKMGRKDLAQAAGISYPYMSEIEHDTKDPSVKVLYALSSALGMPASEVMKLGDDIAAGRDVVIPAAVYREG